MSADVIRKYISGGLQALDRMEQASLHAGEISYKTLMKIIRENEDTEYGKKYGFRNIRSYADFARQVPLSEYTDYEPYIERMLCFGEKDLLTSRDVVYFAHTSASSGTSKMIPRTQEELDILFSTVFERVFALCEKSCLEKTVSGIPAWKGINLMESRIGFTPAGIAHGAISETLNIREDTSFYNALPEEIIYPVSEFDRRYVKMLFALRERHLSFLMSTFSPTLYDMITYLCDNWQSLCADLEAGRTDPDVAMDNALRTRLDACLSPDPERAAEIRQIMTAHREDAFIPLLWPELKLVATVGTSTFAPYIEKLRQHLGPDIAVDYLGYVSSESTVAAELHEDEPSYLLLPFSGFYEFIPVDSDTSEPPLTLDQLEAGKEYELILTNLSGFYRYRINDVIRVTGFHNKCPMIVFAYRKNQLVNMYGEKMADSVVQSAVQALSEESGTRILEYSVYPDSGIDPGRYVVLLESDEEITPERWPFYSDILNRKLCEAHDSYRKKILQKTMRPLEVRFVQPQTYALYRDLKVMDGASPNQIKPIHVITDGKLKRFFFGLLQE